MNYIFVAVQVVEDFAIDIGSGQCRIAPEDLEGKGLKEDVSLVNKEREVDLQACLWHYSRPRQHHYYDYHLNYLS